MNELTKFKNRIYLHALGIGVIAEVVSVFFVGLSGQFASGLVLGVLVAIINFNITAFCGARALTSGNPFVTMVGFIIRLALYGVSFFISIKVSYEMAIACGIGLLSVQLAIMWIHMIKPAMKKT